MVEMVAHTLADEMRRQARLIGEALPDEPAQLPQAARRISSLANRRMTIVDSTGRVLGDSEFDDESLALLDNHLSRPEIAEAWAAGSGVAKRFSTSTNRVELKVAVREWPGVVRVSAPMDQVDAVIADAQRSVFLAALVALALGIILAWAVERQITRPLDQLVAAWPAAGHPPTPPRPFSKSGSWSGRSAPCRRNCPSAWTSCGGVGRRPPCCWARWSKA